MIIFNKKLVLKDSVVERTFNSCNELINHYKNNFIRISDSEIKFKLGKAISLPECIKMFELEIKKSESVKIKLG